MGKHTYTHKTRVYFGNGVELPPAMSLRQLVCQICVLVYHCTLNMQFCLFLPHQCEFAVHTRREMLFVMPIRKLGGGEDNYLLQCISLWKEKHGGKDRGGKGDKVQFVRLSRREECYDTWTVTVRKVKVQTFYFKINVVSKFKIHQWVKMWSNTYWNTQGQIFLVTKQLQGWLLHSDFMFFSPAAVALHCYSWKWLFFWHHWKLAHYQNRLLFLFF